MLVRDQTPDKKKVKIVKTGEREREKEEKFLAQVIRKKCGYRGRFAKKETKDHHFEKAKLTEFSTLLPVRSVTSYT